MELDLQLGIAEMFRDATMESAVRALRTDDDWDRFKAIQSAAEKREDEATREFERDRPDLLAQAREAILRDAGALKHDHPAPMPVDRFDPGTIEKRAETRIETAHRARLLDIRREESDAYETLSQDISARERQRGLSREAFGRARDGRGGPERTRPTRDR